MASHKRLSARVAELLSRLASLGTREASLPCGSPLPPEPVLRGPLRELHSDLSDFGRALSRQGIEYRNVLCEALCNCVSLHTPLRVQAIPWSRRRWRVFITNKRPHPGESGFLLSGHLTACASSDFRQMLRGKNNCCTKNTLKIKP